MRKYKAIYKCRLCGETFSFSCGGEFSEDKLVKKISLMGAMPIPFFWKWDNGREPHGCANGSVGVADLQGFEKV